MYGGFYAMGNGTHQGHGFGPFPTVHQHHHQQRYGPQQLQLRMQAPPRVAGPYGPSFCPSQAVRGGTEDALPRNSSFMLDNNGSYCRPNTMMQRVGSLGSMGSVGMMSRFNSFRPSPQNGGPPERQGSFSSFGTGAGSLHRVHSGINFTYPTDSQSSWGGSLLPGNRYGGVQQRDPSPQRLGRHLSSASLYSYGSFRQPSFATAGMSTGATGLGPGLSLNGMPPPSASDCDDAGDSCVMSASPAGGVSGSRVNATAVSTTARGFPESNTVVLQRSHSAAYQFSNAGGYSAGNVNDNNLSAVPPRATPPFPQCMPGYSQMNRGGAGMVTLSAITASPMYQGNAPSLKTDAYYQAIRQQEYQRRISEGNRPDSGTTGLQPTPAKGTSEHTTVLEGQPQALGRKNSVMNLQRKNSEKRVGMYFKNKEVTEQDGLQYKKDGDPGTSSKNGSNTRDPSLTNTLKTCLLLDMSSGQNPAIEVDGRMIRAERDGAEEIHKYDFSDIIYVHRKTDIQLSSDYIEEIRDNFVYGCNVGMIMADSGCPAAFPTEWFTWLALKSVVKGVFGKLTGMRFEFTVSVCLLQDDQVMDLLSDSPQRFVTLTVAESPLFGNVANGMVYICVDDAGDFNDVLDASLCRAQEQCSLSAGEQGIVLCTCVLKQMKTSASTNKEDVIISSIFASGVGDGVIHYHRILDKNPAEPRALFHSVLHRSVHSTALFSCGMNDEEIFNYLATLQRFSKVELRRPKVGSVRAFIAYGTHTIPKMREDLEKMTDHRQRLMLSRHLDKLELMVADAEDMLESPADCVPKTYT